MSAHKLANLDQIDRLIEGRCADPFAVLGLHQTKAGIEVRALMPDAVSICVIDSKTKEKLATLQRIDERGFFCALTPLRQDRFSYQLLVTWSDSEQILDDPYRFGTLLQELDTWLLTEGKHLYSYEHLGAHASRLDGVDGFTFSLWAPNAQRVSIVGDFNFWDGRRNPMRLRKESGVWELFLPGINIGQRYKYEIIDCYGHTQLKADPYAFAAEIRPNTASITAHLPPEAPSSEQRQKANAFSAPISIYEVHLGSWRRHSDNNFWLSYQQLAEQLIPYVKLMGFTHIELMPINEHPFDGSWGYQPLGLYAPTSRFGSPADFRHFIDRAHQAGINVLLDWVPGHFPSDTYGLVKFDGTALYEYADPREGFHQDWSTLIYNYSRYEVRNYLVANAIYWVKRFSIDGLRIDAVSSMLYRDYSRSEGQWLPNCYGGNKNLEAIEFLRYTNQALGRECPGTITLAEESTDYGGVTLPPENNGLGFHYKWNMGWMNDTLAYMQEDPINRKYHHNRLTFGILYAYSENFVLPLSHDEVVHGKGSLYGRMPGDQWQKFANLRAYYGFMWGFPGKKLLFMGGEFGQKREWNHDVSLDWHLLDDPDSGHRGVQSLVRDLNHCYQQNSPLYQRDFAPDGFEWLVADDSDNSVFAFIRRDAQGNEIIVVTNFTPVPRHHYRIGIHQPGHYDELLNTDDEGYYGSNMSNQGGITSEKLSCHGKPYSLDLTLPPLATLYLKRKSV